MKIVKPLTLGILTKPYRYRGRHHFVVAALGFFRLGNSENKAENKAGSEAEFDDARFLTENLQWPKVLAALPLGQPLTELMPKSRGEVLVAGSAYAPHAKPVAKMTVRLCLHDSSGATHVEKSLVVCGERNWASSWAMPCRLSSPCTFTQMPLRYERAFGGEEIAENPIGCGHRGKGWLTRFKSASGSVPNITYPNAPFYSPCSRIPSAGFGAIDMRWAPRNAKHGRFDQTWLDRDAPGLAENVDWSLFNIAPQDQWLDRPIAGGECYVLEGMHPTLPRIEGKLPKVHARAFVVRTGKKPADAEEVPLQCDTVWFFPDAEIGVLIYHGQTSINDSDALDVDAVMVAYEHQHAPKSLSHYRDVMALRLDPEQAALHAFNESQLVPERSAASVQLRQTKEEAELAAQLAKQQTLINLLDAQFWEQSGLTPPPDHQPARATPPTLNAPSQQAIDEGDFDLSGMVAQAKKMAEHVAQEAQAKRDALSDSQAELALASANPAPAIDLTAQREASLARASIPALDLLDPHAAANALPDDLRALLETVQATETDEKFTQLNAVRAAIVGIPALKRKARNAALRATPEPLLPELAAWLGDTVKQWIAAGVPLVGRDLAGADLRGVNFDGLDLREILLEKADLRGASFKGANLCGATLTETKIDGCDFSHAQLSGANLCASVGQAARFNHANLDGVRAINAQWRKASLAHAQWNDGIALNIDLSEAVLDDLRMARTVIIAAKAAHSRWRSAQLEKVVALGAQLEHADFSRAALTKVVLLDAKLHRSQWEHAQLVGIYGGGNADWSHAQCRGMRAQACGWHGASFACADLRDVALLACDFGMCELSHADLRAGLFSRSLFMRSRMTHVQAVDADFYQALLRKADLSCANLRGANLYQVEYSDANFTGACLDGIRIEAHRRAA